MHECIIPPLPCPSLPPWEGEGEGEPGRWQTRPAAGSRSSTAGLGLGIHSSISVFTTWVCSVCHHPLYMGVYMGDLHGYLYGYLHGDLHGCLHGYVHGCSPHWQHAEHRNKEVFKNKQNKRTKEQNNTTPKFRYITTNKDYSPNQHPWSHTQTKGQASKQVSKQASTITNLTCKQASIITNLTCKHWQAMKHSNNKEPAGTQAQVTFHEGSTSVVRPLGQTRSC